MFPEGKTRKFIRVMMKVKMADVSKMECTSRKIVQTVRV